jgi:hypothetical protein
MTSFLICIYFDLHFDRGIEIKKSSRKAAQTEGKRLYLKGIRNGN